jgi:hypothetical protein
VFAYPRLSGQRVSSFVRIASLAAAPLGVWQPAGRATSHGVACFSGRRGCGAPKTLLKLLDQAHTHDRHAECDAPPRGTSPIILFFCHTA